jgi:hypothetical protein
VSPPCGERTLIFARVRPAFYGVRGPVRVTLKKGKHFSVVLYSFAYFLVQLLIFAYFLVQLFWPFKPLFTRFTQSSNLDTHRTGGTTALELRARMIPAR